MNRRILTILFVIISVSQINAHEIDSTLSITDSSAIFLNKIESINSIYSDLEIITEKEFEHVYSVNFLSTLKGKMNGVEVQTGTWGNNASSVFFIRGEKNISSSNQPLIVIDGIPITNQISSRFGFDLGNLANNWNIDDIETISVLKGGLAASLYGNQGGNGAIIIQTKKAKEKGLHVDFNSSFVASQIADFPEFQNSFGQGSNGQFEYFDGLGGGTNDGVDYNWGPPLDLGLLIPQFDGPATGYINGEIVTVRGADTWAREQATLNGINSYITPTPWVSHPDNMKDYFKTAMTYANNIGISWVNKYGGIRVSYTNVQADNVTPNSKLIKNTISTNLNYTFFDRLNIFGTINNTAQEQTNLIIPGKYTDLNPMAMFPWLGRQVDMNSLKNYWQAGQESIQSNTDIQHFNYIYEYEANPWALAYENSHPMTRNNLFSSYGVKLDLFKQFSINYIGGYNKINSELLIDNNIQSYNNEGKETFDEKNLRHNIFFNLDFNVGKNHFINSFAGFYKNKKNNESYYENVSTYNVPWGGSSNAPTIISNRNTNKTSGYYGGLSYSCFNIFYTRFTLSKDIFDDFKNVETPLYPSFSAAIELHDILKIPNIVSKLNFHGGYSKLGLSVVPINYVTNITYGTSYSSFNKSINNSLQNSASSLPSNEVFSSITEKSFGMIIGLMNNRFLIRPNWYSNITENGFYENVIPDFFTIYEYDKSVENEGFEFNLALIPLLQEKISWKSEISYFKNKNNVVDIGDLMAVNRSGSWHVDILSKEGLPVSSLYGQQFLRYEDQIVFEKGLPVADPEYDILGDVNPDYIMYFSNYLNVYKFKISFLLNYSHGGKYFSPFFRFSTMAGSSYHTINRESGVVGQGVMWDETSNSYVPNNVVVEAEDYYYGMSHIYEYSIMDATSLSIDEISISYDFRFMDKFNLSCTLFGQNIYTWAKNFDYNQSNIQFNNNQFYRGINDFSLPNTRTFGLKLQLKI